MKQIVKRALTILIMAVAIVGAAPLNDVFAATIGARSPVGANSTPAGDHSHYIRRDSVKGTMRLELYGYWTTGGTAGKYFYLNRGADMLCDRRGSTGNRVGHVQVTAGTSVRDYFIRGANMCGANSNRSNVAGVNSNNVFFGRYSLPGSAMGAAVTDSNGRTWYRARIIVQWGADARELARTHLYANGSSGAIIGQAGQQGLTSVNARRQTRFPINGRLNDSSGSSSFNLPFGMTCPLNAAAIQDPSIGRNRLVTLYDADNGGGTNDNTVRLRVRDVTTNRWVAMDTPIGGVRDMSNTRFTPNRGEALETSVEIDMIPYHLYEVVVSGIDSRGTNNVVSVGLPFDSIYGYINCPEPVEYNITPTVAISSPTYSYYNNLSIPWSAVVSGLTNGTMANVGSHPVDLWRIVYAPGVAVAGSAIQSADNACPVPGGYKGCSRVAAFSASNPTNASPPGSFRLHSSTRAESSGPDEPGTRTCYVSRVANPTQNITTPSTWRPSNIVCAMSMKQPTVQFHGSDVKINGKVNTSTFTTRASDDTQKTFGSWVEYGIFSTDDNEVASSGAGLKEGNTESTKSSWSALTFANTPEPYGGYDPLPGLSNARTYFESLPETNASSSIDYTQSGVYDVGNISLGGTVTARGKSIIIRSSGTVTLTSPITVSNTGLTNVRDISQVVIIANKIDIKDSVGNVDAWLMTRPGGGGIDTCDDAPARLTTLICNNQLTINGAVMTDRLNLRRTHGADAASPGAPAEVIRLRPDSQLWAYTYANQGDRAQTVNLIELPPRF